MFNNDLFMTNGVSNTIGANLLINIMQAVTVFAKPGELDTDYFLVIKCSNDNNLQKIEISQECPIRKEFFRFESENIFEEKLWFIDDGDHSTLLYPEEY